MHSSQLLCRSKYINTSLQSQKAVTAYLKSKQLLPFGFARQYTAVSHQHRAT